MLCGLTLFLLVSSITESFQIEDYQYNYDVPTSFLNRTLFEEYDKDLANAKVLVLKNYDKDIRPRFGSNLDVSFHFTLVGIIGLDSISEVITTAGHLLLRWNDYRLAWTQHINETQRATLTKYAIKFPQSKLWTPNVQLRNSVEDFKELGGSFMFLNVTADGTVVWNPFQKFESVCTMDIQKYPFDIQKCQLDFVVWGETNNAMTMSLMVQSFSLNIQNGEWDIINMATVLTSNAFEEPSTAVKLVMRRKWLNVLTNLIIPVVILAFLNIFTFMIPSDSGEKTGYTMTVFLSFAVFLSILADRLPANSDKLSYLGIYLVALLVQSSTVVVLSSIQVRIVNNETAVPSFLTKMTRILNMKCTKPCSRQQTEMDPNRSTETLKSRSSGIFIVSEYNKVHPLQIGVKEDKIGVEEEKIRVEEEIIRAEEENIRVEKEIIRVEEEIIRAEEKKIRVEKEKIRVEEEKMHVDEEKIRVEKEKIRVEEEKSEVETVTDHADEEEDTSVTSDVSWKEACSAMDVVAFWMSLLILVIITFVYFTVTT